MLRFLYEWGMRQNFVLTRNIINILGENKTKFGNEKAVISALPTSKGIEDR